MRARARRLRPIPAEIQRRSHRLERPETPRRMDRYLAHAARPAKPDLETAKWEALERVARAWSARLSVNVSEPGYFA